MSELPAHIKRRAEGVEISVLLQPRSSKTRTMGVYGDSLKIAVTAPPVEGKANQALIEFVSAALKLPKSSISIVSGESSRRKKLLVLGVSPEELPEEFIR